MYFSLSQGDKVAKIKGGPDDGKYLRLVTRQNFTKEMSKAKNLKKIKFKKETVPIIDIYNFLSEDEIRHMEKGMSYKDLLSVESYLKGEKKEKKEKKKKAYEIAKIALQEQNEKEYKTVGMLIPVPKKEATQRNIYYLAGPSGSGKSYTTGLILHQWKKLYPAGKVYLFSEVKEDKALDPQINYRVMIDQKMVQKPIEPDEFQNKDKRTGVNLGSMVIFDDIDTITDTSLQEAVHKLINKLLQTGRHQNLDIIVTSHQLMDYKKTRTILNEAQNVIVFPESGSSYHIKRFLTLYGGMDKHQINRFMKLPSQWVLLHKSSPQYVMYQHGAFLLR